MFLAYDYPNALPLPEKRYVYRQWYFPTISPDYHIEIEKGYYSVPWTYYKKKIIVAVSHNLVEIYHQTEQIAVHLKSRKQYAYTTDGKHLPPKYQKYSYRPHFNPQNNVHISVLSASYQPMLTAEKRSSEIGLIM